MKLRIDRASDRQRKRTCFVLCIAVALGAGLALADEPLATAIATDTPEATVRTLHGGLLELSSADPPVADVEQRYAALRPLVGATHDLPYIAEFTIRRQWEDLGPADRQRFVDAFERLSVMTYASRFTAVSEDTFELEGDQVLQSGRAQVEATIVRPDAADVPLEYLLEQRNGQWKIINIVADGVSDLALKRAEYQRILADGSIDDLIAHLEQQTGRLR
jgi:phospholipid transport system substrate-binding protein